MTCPVRVSRIPVRVDRFAPAYESPLTKTVQEIIRPLGDTCARLGDPGSGTFFVVSPR
jgi:hypothetical protein